MRKITDLEFDNTYRKLPQEFYDLVNPTPLTNPDLVSFNSDRNQDIVSMFEDQGAISGWVSSYKLRLRAENSNDTERKKHMNLVNPKFILRNYLAENAIIKARDEGDYSEIERLHRILRDPFSEQIQFQDYAEASPHWGKNLVISCSS